jgi:hypothetical protein
LKIVLVSMLLIGVAACGKHDDGGDAQETFWYHHMWPSIKTISWSSFIDNRMESTPVVLNDKLYAIVSHRVGADGSEIEVYSMESENDSEKGALLHTQKSPFGLISALTVKDTLYVFGSTKWEGQNKVMMMSTKNFKTWTAPVTVLEAEPGQTIFNTSVAPAPNGFVMAYEVCEKTVTCFTSRFAISKDLLRWKKVGEPLTRKSYAACPTIRFVNGHFYIFFLAKVGHFATFMARTTNFKKFEFIDDAVLSTFETQGLGNNASDFDFVDYKGRVEMLFADGDQKNWVQIWRARYNGTVEQLVNEIVTRSPLNAFMDKPPQESDAKRLCPYTWTSHGDVIVFPPIPESCPPEAIAQIRKNRDNLMTGSERIEDQTGLPPRK